MSTIRKVYAYITHSDRLLVFSHPHAPEAGIQVPGGTVEPGETTEHAVMREAYEETGLIGLVLGSFLGETTLDRADVGKDEVHQRHFYHLRCTSDPPATWQHYESDPSDGGPPPLFEFFWARLPDEVPELIAGLGALLPRLIGQLKLEGAIIPSSRVAKAD